MSSKESYSISARPELIDQVDSVSDSSRSELVEEALEMLLQTKSGEQRLEQIDNRLDEIDQEVRSLQQEKSELQREKEVIKTRMETEEDEFDEARYESLLREIADKYAEGYDVSVWGEFQTAVSIHPEENETIAEQEVYNDLDQMVGDELWYYETE